MSKELTQYQFQEQLMDVHLGSVEVRVKSMACLRNHDAAQRATIQQLEARIVSLEIDVDRMAWKTSPATAQATIDQLVKQNDQLEAQVKELEADRAIKHNGLRVLAQAVTIHLRVVKTHDDGEALSLAKHILDKPNEPTTTPWLVEMMNQGQVVKQLEAQVKELEEESRQWEKGSLVALLRENKALKALVVQLQGEA